MVYYIQSESEVQIDAHSNGWCCPLDKVSVRTTNTSENYRHGGHTSLVVM